MRVGAALVKDDRPVRVRRGRDDRTAGDVARGDVVMDLGGIDERRELCPQRLWVEQAEG